MDDFPSTLQRQIALYTPEAGFKLQRGDRLLGAQRGIAHEMRNCICGLCVCQRIHNPTLRVRYLIRMERPWFRDSKRSSASQFV